MNWFKIAKLTNRIVKKPNQALHLTQPDSSLGALQVSLVAKGLYTEAYMELIALILIDVQKGFDNPKWGIRNNLNAEQNIKILLDHWRRQRQPVIHIQHHSTEPDSPLRPDDPGCGFKSEAEPIGGEIVFTKQVNSAFIGTGLEEHLRKRCIHRIVVVGLTTDHCVSTTTRMAGNLGFSTILVSDATATFNRLSLDGVNIPADEIHRVHLSSLNGEFCQVQSTDEVLKMMPNPSFNMDWRDNPLPAS